MRRKAHWLEDGLARARLAARARARCPRPQGPVAVAGPSFHGSGSQGRQSAFPPTRRSLASRTLGAGIWPSLAPQGAFRPTPTAAKGKHAYRRAGKARCLPPRARPRGRTSDNLPGGCAAETPRQGAASGHHGQRQALGARASCPRSRRQARMEQARQGHGASPPHKALRKAPLPACREGKMPSPPGPVHAEGRPITCQEAAPQKRRARVCERPWAATGPGGEGILPSLAPTGAHGAGASGSSPASPPHKASMSHKPWRRRPTYPALTSWHRRSAKTTPEPTRARTWQQLSSEEQHRALRQRPRRLC